MFSEPVKLCIWAPAKFFTLQNSDIACDLLKIFYPEGAALLQSTASEQCMQDLPPSWQMVPHHCMQCGMRKGGH